MNDVDSLAKFPYSIRSTIWNKRIGSTCTTKYTNRTSLRFFWYLLRPDWSIPWGAISVWISTNRQIRRKMSKPTVPQIIDQFGRKSYQRKCKDVSYEIIQEFFQKYMFYLKCGLSNIRSVHTQDVFLVGSVFQFWYLFFSGINCNVANLPFCYSQPLMAEHKEIVIDMISRSFADKGDLTTLANVSYENIAEQVRTKHDKQWNQKVAYTFPLVPMAWQRNRKRQQKIYTPYR